MPSCYQRVAIDKEFCSLKKRTQKITSHAIAYEDCTQPPFNQQNQPVIALSRDEAVKIALLNNKTLQADFEDIGIAKADLVQAGFYTNPDVTSVFNIPTKNKFVTNIEAVGLFTLSDLWQVPLRKKVSKDQLEIISLRILQEIIDTIAMAKMAYNDVLLEQTLLENARRIFAEITTFKQQIDYRYNFGFANDLDKHLADVLMATWEIEIVNLNAQYNNALLHLHEALGFDPFSEHLKITDILHYRHIAMPTRETLVKWALDDLPQMLIARMNIQQYEDLIRYEKSRILEDVQVGVSYDREFENSQGAGPAVSISVPLFNQNQAQIAKAEFLLKKAEKELVAQTLSIKENVGKVYQTWQAMQEQVELYTTHLMPSYDAAVVYVEKYNQTMQITSIMAIQTKIGLFEAKKKSINAHYEAFSALTQLEKVVGKQFLNQS